MLAAPSLGKRPTKVPNLKSLRPFPLHMGTLKDFYQMHNTESSFVTGQSTILFAGMYVCTFQPRNVTGWGSEGVKKKKVIKNNNHYNTQKYLFILCQHRKSELQSRANKQNKISKRQCRPALTLTALTINIFSLTHSLTHPLSVGLLRSRE